MGRMARAGLAAALAAATWATPPVPAQACGFDGADVAVQRGMMNWSYPDALHVLGAVAAGQRDGWLDRPPAVAPPVDAARPGTAYAMLRVRFALERLRARLALASYPGTRPAIAVVLLEPMLWSRIDDPGGGLRLAVHADGPQEGDVVVVTEAPVLAALADARLSAADALARGVLRIYGPDTKRSAFRDWLASGDG